MLSVFSCACWPSAYLLRKKRLFRTFVQSKKFSSNDTDFRVIGLGFEFRLFQVTLSEQLTFHESSLFLLSSRGGEITLQTMEGEKLVKLYGLRKCFGVIIPIHSRHGSQNA